MALRAELRHRDYFSDDLREPNLGELLDLVALGTVADVVPLDHNNRILVSQGLKRMRSGKMRPGIRALFEVARRDWRKAQPFDNGFRTGSAHQTPPDGSTICRSVSPACWRATTRKRRHWRRS